MASPPLLVRPTLPPTPLLSSSLTSRGVLPLSLTEEKVFFCHPVQEAWSHLCPAIAKVTGCPEKGLLQIPTECCPLPQGHIALTLLCPCRGHNRGSGKAVVFPPHPKG